MRNRFPVAAVNTQAGYAILRDKGPDLEVWRGADAGWGGAVSDRALFASAPAAWTEMTQAPELTQCQVPCFVAHVQASSGGVAACVLVDRTGHPLTHRQCRALAA